jgi:hypothetical protein
VRFLSHFFRENQKIEVSPAILVKTNPRSSSCAKKAMTTTGAVSGATPGMPGCSIYGQYSSWVGSSGPPNHLNVRRKYCDQECDEADAGESSSPWNQHADPAEALADAADRNEQGVIGQITRHDPEIKAGVYEVIGAGCDKE